jgi:hypothetical protein
VLFTQQSNIRLGGVRSLAFDATGTLLACGGMQVGNIGDGIGTATVLLLDWQTGQKRPPLYPEDGLRTFVNGVAFHPAGFLVAATGGLDQGVLFFWNPDSPETKPFFRFKLPQSGWGMDLHPDYLQIAVAHHGGALGLYEMRDPPGEPAAAAVTAPAG